MPGSGLAPSYPLIGALAVLLLLWEILPRRGASVREGDEPGPSSATSGIPGSPAASWASLLSYLSAMGSVWLIPWAAALYAADPVALLPGLLVVGLILICARYALQTAAAGDDR